MFGSHKAPYKFDQEDLMISVGKIENGIRYGRICRDEDLSKVVSTKEARVVINPVEPLNLPEHITQFMLIEFENPLLVEPKTSHKIYLKFPLEIAVFIERKNDFRVIDILTLTKPKYTMYGKLETGPICRYYKSGVFLKIPSVDKYKEGILSLSVTNESNKWVEVTKAVFNAVGMKLYYGPERVTLKANMRLISELSAETSFLELQQKKDNILAKELFIARKLGLKTTKFLMEDGV